MSRPIIIRNGSNSVINVKDKSEKLIEFGNQYHIYFGSLDIPSFDLTSENIGGIVKYKNKPFGVVGVDSTITGDGSIRIMSINNMSIKYLKTGTSSLTFNDTYGNLMNCCTRYDSFSSTNPPLNTYSNMSVPSTINSSNFEDGWARHKIWLDITDTNATMPNWRTVEYITRLQPYDSQTRGYSDSNICCWRYSPIDGLDSTGYWYTPSFFELILEYRNRTTINDAFASILSMYDYGPGRIPYRTGTNDGFMTSDYDNSYWYGGRVGKYSIYNGSIRPGYNSVQDSNTVQAWCKLIKQDGKWILDPTYHID